MRQFAILFFLLLLVGCGSSRPQADIDRGQKAVTAALDNWKSNAAAASLSSLPDPVEFSEELRLTFTLVNYSIIKVDSTDPEVIRYTVKLELKDKKGKASEREAVYSVALKTPVVVSRDPYF